MRTHKLAIALLVFATACGQSRRTAVGNKDLGTSGGPAPGDSGAGVLGDLSCGSAEFSITRVEPNVFLVLDRSGSMADPISDTNFSGTTKWQDLQTAITSLVNMFGAQMRLGMSLFAGDDDCEAGQIDVPLGDNNGATVLAKLMAAMPESATPTAATMMNVQSNAGLTDTTRSNVIVLATDGVPDCLESGNEDDVVTQTITALAAQTPPVKTFVIGIGSDTEADPTALNAWAVAGGTALTGSTKYYQTSSPTDLNNAFQMIASGVASCTFALNSTPPDPSQLYVWENQTQISADPTNGYTYSASPPSVTLNGTSCTNLQSMTGNQLHVIYGCPGPPPVQ